MEILKELEYEQVTVKIYSIDNKKKEIQIIPKIKNLYIPQSKCITEYSLELIEKIIEVKTPIWICNEILREESENYIFPVIKNGLMSYLKPECFVNKSILDFGCGSGASTIILKKLFPQSYILGVDMIPEFIEIAKLRKKFYSFSNINFKLSDSPEKLDYLNKKFNFIVLNGVFEHFLNEERNNLFPKICDKLEADGILFLNDTPCKYFPIETHTTRLPLLNYMPDFIAYYCVKKFSHRVSPNESWKSLLRAGIRGTTPAEIKKILTNQNKKFLILKPKYLNNKDIIDIWFYSYKSFSYNFEKKIIYLLSKPIYHIFKIPIIPYLSLAIKIIE